MSKSAALLQRGALDLATESRPLIVHVIHHLVIGGMENGLVNLINRLPEDRYRHAVACIEDHSSFAQRIRRRDVEVIDLHRRSRGLWGVRRDLLRHLRLLRPAIVHSRGLSGLDALLPARLAGVPHCVHGEHGWDMDNLDGSSRRALWLRRLHSPLIDRYVTVSQDLRDYLVRRVGIADRRIQAICNGVDTEQFTPGPPADDLGLPADFLRADVMRVGTVGRLQPVKDQATLVAAAALLLARWPQARPRLRLVLVGDGPCRDALAQQVQATALQDVVWFAGATHRVAEWLRAMHVFVLPSLNEGISNTLLEAMASGLPTLATPVGGNVELLEEGVSGRSFAPGQVETLAEHLLDYLQQPELRQAHGEGARARAEQRFSLRTMVGAYDALYGDLVAASGAAR